MSAIGQRLETYRALRAQIEQSILPLATSVDGRRFSFQSAIEGLELRLGGYVALDDALGQVQALEAVEAEVGQVGLPPDDEAALNARLTIRMARGEGVILNRGVEPFHGRRLRPAGPDEVAAWLERSGPKGARLSVGTLPLAGGVPVSLDAGGFDRHTFLCGQSGSGKSYSLGLVLEQLLLRTGLKLVILDPNSDVVQLPETREGADPALVREWQEVSGEIAVRSAGQGPDRLRLRFGELGQDAQAALLALDPIRDREEYAELAALLADQQPQTLDALAGADRPEARRLGQRISNLGLMEYVIWARSDPGTLFDDLDDPSVRCLVVDIGSLPTREEQALVAAGVLGALWQRRARREPVLVVVDEAHNVCPAAPADPLTALATEHAVRIAGEGRKFGIYMLVATQRPQKVHENVLSQCDNLILMRLNSAADADFIRTFYGFAPPGLVGLATDFGLGESLVAGKIASHPAIVRFGARVAREGGGDVDSGWSAGR